MGLRWYRFDPDRNERRHVPVAAHTQEWEFNQAWRELSKDLEQRKSLGLSEDIEHTFRESYLNAAIWNASDRIGCRDA